jgi:hypothetical protein
MQGITARKKSEYIEGHHALENFEKGMKSLFQAPKKSVPPKKKTRKRRAKTLKVRPANPMFSAILARLKTARAFSIRAAQSVCLPAHHR